MNSSQKCQQVDSICIVRLSAIGDVTHMIPIIHSIQRFSPNIKITWIIGKTEFKLVGDLPGVEFIQFDKSGGISAFIHVLRQTQGRKFQAVLAAQVSLRANILTALLRANRKIGYDAKRSKDLHGLVINERIDFAQEHVLDSFFRFIERLGIAHKSLDWSLPIPKDAEQFAATHIDGNSPTLAISPCSSHPLRNWQAEAYAEVAQYAHANYQMQTVLLGGNSATEKEYGEKISSLIDHAPINLIGKDTLKKLLAVLKRVDVLVTPDSGPAHIATCVNTPVIGLHAASNFRRSGPYLSQQWCVDKYPEAARLIFQKEPEELKWGTKIEEKGVMNLITPKDVILKLDQIMKKTLK